MPRRAKGIRSYLERLIAGTLSKIGSMPCRWALHPMGERVAPGRGVHPPQDELEGARGCYVTERASL